MKTRILSILTALCLCLTLLPTAAFATLTKNEDGYYTIDSADTLYEFVTLVNGGTVASANAILTQDITVNDCTFDENGNPSSSISIREWKPIGTADHPYTGTFNGQNHKISGLYYKSGDDADVGLFGYIKNSTVKNVTVADSYIESYYTRECDSYIGGVVGYSQNSTVENCHNSSSTVKGLGAYGGYIGGIVGRFAVESGTRKLENCTNSGHITGTATMMCTSVCVGGIVGENFALKNISITGCVNSGNISASGDIGNSDNAYAGGIVGCSYGDESVTPSPTVTVQNCGNSGNITAGGCWAFAGGLMGDSNVYAPATIKNCYSSGNITASAGETNRFYAGGIVGETEENDTIQNCYYLSNSETDALDGTTAKPQTAFSSGEVTYLLNGSKSTSPVWYQTLSGTSADSLPTLDNTHGVVYHGYTSCAEVYTNDSSISATQQPHQFENGSCKNCSATFTITANKPSYTCGDTATLTVEMTGVTGEKTYQWSKSDGQDYTTISGATSKTYTTPILTENGTYKCTVTITGVRTYGSSSITLTVNKKTATEPTLDTKSATYTGSPIEHQLEALPTGVASAKYEYEGINGTTYAKSETAPTAVGEYSVTITFTMNEGYEQLAPVTSALTIQPKPSSGSSTPSYPVAASDTTNGSVTVSPKNASKGTTVTVTVTPDSGYTLETLTVLDKNGNALELTDKGNGRYSFKMPAGKVEVAATFMDDNSMLNFFADVPADAYYYDAVLWAAENGITGGIDENHFGPGLSCARAQLVTFLWRAAGCPAVNYAMDFSDVGDGYYTEAVRWAASLGIVGGYGNGLFGSDDTITREQFVTILYRFAKSVGMDTSAGEDTNILSYNDAFEVSEYAVEAMQWAVGAGIMQGYNGDLMPGQPCTRAQIVTMLYRLLGE